MATTRKRSRLPQVLDVMAYIMLGIYVLGAVNALLLWQTNQAATGDALLAGLLAVVSCLVMAVVYFVLIRGAAQLVRYLLRIEAKSGQPAAWEARP